LQEQAQEQAPASHEQQLPAAGPPAGPAPQEGLQEGH
jgi:hypothetical protein